MNIHNAYLKFLSPDGETTTTISVSDLINSGTPIDDDGDDYELVSGDFIPDYQATFEQIMQSEVFRLDGKKINLVSRLIELAQQVENNNQINWSLGEGLECSLDTLISGAYWAMSEWHAGQNSASYRCLSALGIIFSPGASGPPKEYEHPDYVAYEMVSKWCEANKSLL
jgi:hypothetical protein